MLNRATNLVQAYRHKARRQLAWLPLCLLPLIPGALAAAWARIDLAAFDALKRSVALPDGETLA